MCILWLGYSCCEKNFYVILDCSEFLEDLDRIFLLRFVMVVLRIYIYYFLYIVLLLLDLG